MTIKTRLIILVSCATLFLILAPWIVLYSLGYRVDFLTLSIKGTGGIYVYALPEPSIISIDGKAAEKTSLFSSAVFVQNMLPGLHGVLIKKEGYYDYQKELLVEEKEVAKLEDVILFKQETEFTALQNNVNYFSVSPGENILLTAKITAKKIDFEILDLGNNQKKTVSLPAGNAKISDAIWAQSTTEILLNISQNHYLLDATGPKPTITAFPLPAGANQINFNPQNSKELFFIKGKDFYSNLKTLPVIKSAAVYDINGATITWLSYDGFLYQSDLAGTQINKISSKEFGIEIGALYEINMMGGLTFLKENDTLFFLNKDDNVFQIFYDSVKKMAHSPNNQRILYYNDHQIIISSAQKNHQDKILLDTYTDTIHDAHWLNDHYLVIAASDTITISEIDTRGNINKIVLPKAVTVNELATQANSNVPAEITKTVTMKTPEIFFDRQTKKLYILSEKNLVVSEKLIP